MSQNRRTPGTDKGRLPNTRTNYTRPARNIEETETNYQDDKTINLYCHILPTMVCNIYWGLLRV
jgi:hypothetical protein